MVDAPKAVSVKPTDIPDKDKMQKIYTSLLKGKTIAQIQQIFPTARIMDYNGDGKFNVGKKAKYGDTIDIENPFDGTTTSYHLVKRGEPAGIAGTVDTRTLSTKNLLSRRLQDEYFGKIKTTYIPTMDNFTDINKDGIFNAGDSFTEKLPNGKLRKYYIVKDGDRPDILYKKILGENYTPEMVEDLKRQNRTNQFLANDLIYYNF